MRGKQKHNDQRQGNHIRKGHARSSVGVMVLWVYELHTCCDQTDGYLFERDFVASQSVDCLTAVFIVAAID